MPLPGFDFAVCQLQIPHPFIHWLQYTCFPGKRQGNSKETPLFSLLFPALCGKIQKTFVERGGSGVRKLLIFLSITVLLLTLTLSVSADTAVSRLAIQAVVDADGGCQITQMLSVRVGDPDETILYPLPANAQNIRLGSGRVRTRGGNGVIYVDLTAAGAMGGEPTFIMSYSLDNVLQLTETGAIQRTAYEISALTAEAIDQNR